MSKALIAILPLRDGIAATVVAGLLLATLAVPRSHAAEMPCACGSQSPPARCDCGSLPPDGRYYQTPDAESPPGDSLMIPPGLEPPAAAPPADFSPLLASSFGAATGALAAAPNMMGDLFGAPGGTTMIGREFICTGYNDDNVFLICPDEMRTFEHAEGLSFPQFGLDTNGDGRIDFLPNLVDVDEVNQASLDAPQPVNGPYFAVARSYVPNGSLPDDIDTADVYREVVINAPSPGSGLVLGRLKIAENNSPLPRDRVFVNYSHFSNVPLFPGGVQVNRVTPGFEKSFGDGLMSLEFRFPFGTTLDNDITADGITSTDELLVGNMMIVYKAILLSGDSWAFTGGLSATLPTADDLRVGLADGTPLLQVNNKSVHLSPYLAYLGMPGERFFFQAFLQGEFDANGNPVDAQGTGGQLEQIGRLNDTNYLYLDLGLGYYLYRNRFDRLITSLAPVAELHWNKTLGATDVIRGGGVQVGNFAENVDLLNGVVGLHMTLGDATTVTAGYATPIGAGDNAQFDGEFRLLVNHYFGGR